MSIFVRKLDGIAAATNIVDVIAQLPGLHNDCPSLIGFQYWLHTAGGGSAGSWSININYADPLGNVIVLPGTPISLQIPGGIYSSPVQVIERLSDVSQFEIEEFLNGSADGALVSYRVLFTNPDSNDASFFNN